MSHEIDQFFSCLKRLIFSSSNRYTLKIEIYGIFVFYALICVFSIVDGTIGQLKASEASFIHGFKVISSIDDLRVRDYLWLRVLRMVCGHVRHLFYLINYTAVII